MKINIHVIATVELYGAGPVNLQIEVPGVDGVQTVEWSQLTIQPYVAMQPYRDIFGNPCRRAVLPVGESRIGYDALVEIPDRRSPIIRPIETDVMGLDADVMHYLLPSRYCPSDRLDQFARTEFEHVDAGYARVQTICGWINANVTYQHGTSTSATTAFDTATERHGVCRDFAHLGISLCRALNIPARYVSGYCLGLNPPDFHAYFEAYLDGQWVAFDATEIQPRRALAAVAIGRDAADCAWSSFFSPGATKALVVNVAEAN